MTATTEPLEARCDHCKQLRPLFAYRPDHNMHLGAGAFTCRWCTRDKQPLLCTRCWGAEREREENNPALNEEAETWDLIATANARVDARRTEQVEADRAMCEGIAAATEQHTAEGGA